MANQIPERRVKALERAIDQVGTNPCGEIHSAAEAILQSFGSRRARGRHRGNAYEENARRDHPRHLSINAHEFPYLSKDWKKHCEDGRLLGVSITGQWDCPAVRNENVLRTLRDYAIEVNREYAKRFGINRFDRDHLREAVRHRFADR